MKNKCNSCFGVIFVLFSGCVGGVVIQPSL